MSIEDIKEAIEVLEDASAEMLMETGDKDYYREAIAILRQALETEQKTAVSPGKGTGFNYARALGITVLQPALETKQKLYTAPVDAINISQENVDETAERKHIADLASVGEVGVWGESEWVGLTDDEIVSVANTVDGFGVIKQRDMNFAKSIEAKLKEKNA